MDKTVVIKPRMSEKAYAVTQEKNTYVFDVPGDLNKHSIADAIKAYYEVTVTKVRVVNVKGKSKRTIAKKGRIVRKGQNATIKKAYITLKDGESLPIFAAVEEAEAKEKATEEKVAKAIEKQAEKEAKPARRGLRRAKKEEQA